MDLLRGEKKGKVSFKRGDRILVLLGFTQFCPYLAPALYPLHMLYPSVRCPATEGLSLWELWMDVPSACPFAAAAQKCTTVAQHHTNAKGHAQPEHEFCQQKAQIGLVGPSVIDI